MNLGDYIGQQVQQAMAKALDQWWGDPRGDMTNAAQAGADELSQDMTPGTGGLLGFLEGLPIVGGLISDVVDPLKGVLGQAGGMIEGLALGWGLGGVVNQVLEPAFASVIYSAHRAALDARHDTAQAARMWAQGIMSQAQAEAEGHDQGYDPNRVDQLHAAAVTYPDVGSLLDMRNRGLIDDSQLALALSRHGFDPFWSSYVAGLHRQLLGGADLALGHLRGDVSDSLLASYGAQIGIDPGDMQILIANTGEPPGTEELLFAYRRGIIDQPTLERGVRQSRVRNEWIPTIEALRFVPMSTSDAVRAVVQNYLDTGAGQQIAEANGLEPDHWQFLVESYGRPLSHEQMLTLYYRGQASLAQVQQAVRESDVKDKYIDQAVQLGRRLIPERQVTQMLQHGVIDGATAISYLMLQGYNQQDATWLTQLGQVEHHAAIKQLTQGEITSLYSERAMTRQEAHDQLVKLGYDGSIADWLIELADAKRQAQLARTLQTQVKALLQHGDIDQPEARRRLVAGGVPADSAQALTDEWEILHGVPSRQLSESQVIKAAEYQILSVDGARVRLQGLGYSPANTTILLQLAGLVPIQAQTGDPGGGGGPPPPPPPPPTGTP